MSKRENNYQQAIDLLDSFFNAFPLADARQRLHLMFRSAFARKNNLNKRDIKDLLFLRDQMTDLIYAAQLLESVKGFKPLLKKIFRWRRVGQWQQTLNDLFYAAVYDGIGFTNPVEDDIYHACRGLLRMVAICHDIYEQKAVVTDDKA
ncbi:MAG: hypothetical protein JST39_10745 [Bacteroidetes bacterium]|nr:hypothetical protein [Bacteroidota bacterium]